MMKKLQAVCQLISGLKNECWLFSLQPNTMEEYLKREKVIFTGFPIDYDILIRLIYSISIKVMAYVYIKTLLVHCCKPVQESGFNPVNLVIRLQEKPAVVIW